MQSENRLFDDFVKFMNGAAGTIAGMGREAEGAARERFKEWVGGTDFVSREEFEAVKAIAVSAQEEVAKLRAELAKAPKPAAKTSAAGNAGPAE